MPTMASHPRLARDRRLATVLVAAFAVLAISYSMVVPIFETPDEPGHVDYLLHLIQQRALPVQSAERATYAHHPPLYYALAALPASVARLDAIDTMPQIKPDFRWTGGDSPAIAYHHTSETFPYRGRALAVHLARLVSVLCGGLTVALTVAIGWHVFPHSRSVGLLAGALVAFNPQFLLVSASVSNDALTAATSAGALWQLLQALDRPGRALRWALLGAWLGAAVLSKAAGVVACGVAALAWSTWAMRSRRRALALRAGGACVLVFVLVAGWWFVRNQTLYGDPLGWGIYRQAWAAVLRPHPPSLAEWLPLARTAFRSYWGVFGWMNVHMPAWWYAGMAALTAAGLLGWAVALWRRARRRDGWRWEPALLTAALALQGAFLVYQNISLDASHAQGRYLFPAVAPAMALLAAGLLPMQRRRIRAWAGAALAGVLLSAAVLALALVIVPAYRVVPLRKSALWTVPHRGDEVFGGMLSLRGYALRTQDSPEGPRVTLRLYWQARLPIDFDYTVFVHAVSADGALLAQDDHAPGAGASYLPRAWQVEDIVADAWVVSLPPEARGRGVRLHIGLYNWQTGARLLSASGQDHLVIDLPH